MKSSEFDQRFDHGESVLQSLDLSKAKRLQLNEQEQVNTDFPLWMVEQLDQEASRLGVTRQEIIKLRLTSWRKNQPDATSESKPTFWWWYHTLGGLDKGRDPNV